MKIAKTYILLILGATQILISCTSNKFEEKSPLEIENKNSDFSISQRKRPKEKDLETHSAREATQISTLIRKEKIHFGKILPRSSVSIERLTG